MEIFKYISKNNFISILNKNIYPNKIISNNNNLKRYINWMAPGKLVSKAAYENSNILMDQVIKSIFCKT